MADHSLMSFSCPECGGSMVFNPEKGKLQCEYCDSLFTREEVEKFFAEKEKKIGEKDSKKDWGEDDSVRGYNCSSCGAELITDANTAVIRCPYCGNQTVAPIQFTGAMKPDYVVPFAFTKKQAMDSFKKYYESKFLLPAAFKSDAKVDEIQGVYVPFWLFNGTADAAGSYEAYDRREEGHYEITDYYQAERKGRIGFTNVPTDASVRMADDLMDSIEPYKFDKLEEFTTAYLPGFMAEKFDVEISQDIDRAKKRVEESVKRKIHDTIGHDGYNIKQENIDVKFSMTAYALLPVWILTTNWNGKPWTFAMNGQTGKFIGDLPVSKAKLTGISVLTFIISFIVFSFIWGLS